MSYFLPPDSGNRLPVSLLTGFLGSGKTALVNRLLRFPEMARTAILINEFGDVALDQLFVQASEGEVTVLPNGCLCCDVRGDLEGAIGTLFARRGRGDGPAFDRLLIETTGLADPAPIMQMLLNQPLIVDNFRLDAVVTTVDALHGARQLREHPEAVNQVLLADRLVVTKTDLAEDAQVGELVAALGSLNAIASVFHVPRTDVNPVDLFGANRTHIAPQAPVHDHLHGIETFSLSCERPVEWRAFTNWLTAIKTSHADQLLRVKGVVHVANEDEPIAINGVHHVFHPPMRLAQPDLSDRQSRIVFITRGLPRDIVEIGWRRVVQ
jgi:G3E family GTPase